MGSSQATCAGNKHMKLRENRPISVLDCSSAESQVGGLFNGGTLLWWERQGCENGGGERCTMRNRGGENRGAEARR